MILAMFLWLQVLHGQQYYVLDYPQGDNQLLLVADNGRYPIDLGSGCDGFPVGVNVEWLAGSNNVGAIRQLGSDALCNVYMELPVSDLPCLQTDGVCDVAREFGP